VSFNPPPQHPRSRTPVIRTEQIAIPGQASGTLGPESGPVALQSQPAKPAPAASVDSANGYRLVGRQGLKAGGPRQPLAIAPAHESRSGNWLMTQPLRFEKIPRNQRSLSRPVVAGDRNQSANRKEKRPGGGPAGSFHFVFRGHGNFIPSTAARTALCGLVKTGFASGPMPRP
jgi:hypothetical protein